nr:hypothetical protein [Actinacidiphila acididurans]
MSITSLANSAVTRGDSGVASTVLNQTALLASDVGDSDLASDLCHRHAAAYLHACPQPGATVIRALEPVVNLARLLIRAGRHDEGRRHLLALYESVSAGVAARVENIDVPAALTTTAQDQQEVRAWLWRVLIADGTRALTTAGRWADALDHIKEHRGVGKRMLDGRQVAVLAALTSGDAHGAAELLAGTAPGDPWEQAVTMTLAVFCDRALGQLVEDDLDGLADVYERMPAEPGMTVFTTRLGLSMLDAIGHAEHPAAYRIAESLHRRSTATTDGYAARECLASLAFDAAAQPGWRTGYRQLVKDCSLGAGTLPGGLLTELMEAVCVGDQVIRQNLRRAQRSYR